MAYTTKFVVKADHLDDLVRLGTMPKQAATFLEAAVASGLNILVAGGTQAGNAATPQSPTWHKCVSPISEDALPLGCIHA